MQKQCGQVACRTIAEQKNRVPSELCWMQGSPACQKQTSMCLCMCMCVLVCVCVCILFYLFLNVYFFSKGD